MARKYKKGGYEAAYGGENTAGKRFSPTAVIIIALAVVAAILLTVFLVNFFFSPRLTTRNGGATLKDRRHGITYNLAPDCYSADLDTEKPYATVDGVDYYKLIYSDANGEEKTYDPLKMIGTKDEYGEVTLYVAEGVKLPSLAEFGTDKALVYYIRLVEYLARAVSPTTSQEVAALMVEGEAVLRPLKVDEDTIRMIYFGSSTYPHITYSIKYYEDYANGRYLYDSTTDKCIKLGDDVFKEVFA